MKGIYALVDVAEPRGYDHGAHLRALAYGTEDDIALTHPSNWLTEEEVESAPPVETEEVKS